MRLENLLLVGVMLFAWLTWRAILRLRKFQRSFARAEELIGFAVPSVKLTAIDVYRKKCEVALLAGGALFLLSTWLVERGLEVGERPNPSLFAIKVGLLTLLFSALAAVSYEVLDDTEYHEFRRGRAAEWCERGLKIYRELRKGEHAFANTRWHSEGEVINAYEKLARQREAWNRWKLTHEPEFGRKRIELAALGMAIPEFLDDNVVGADPPATGAVQRAPRMIC